MLFFKYFSMAEETLKTTSDYCFAKAHAGEIELYLDAGNYSGDCKQVGSLISDFKLALGRDPRKKQRASCTSTTIQTTTTKCPYGC